MNHEVDSDVEQLIIDLDFEQFDLFRRFERTKSFQAVGVEVHRSPNSVRDRMLRMSKVFEQRFGEPLIVQEGTRYALSSRGRHVADSSQSLMEWLGQMVEEHRRETIYYEVACASNALPLFTRLNKAISYLDDECEFELRPRPLKTADLQLYGNKRLDLPLALGSILASSAQIADAEAHKSVLKIRPRSNLEVFVDTVDSIYLVASPDLELEAEVDLSKTLAMGATIMMPRGGVVWRFLQELYGDWYLRWPRQFCEVPTRSYAMEMMRERMVKRSIMVLHGERSAIARDLPRTSIHRARDMNGIGHKALTGLIIERTIDVDPAHLRLIETAAEQVISTKYRS